MILIILSMLINSSGDNTPTMAHRFLELEREAGCYQDSLPDSILNKLLNDAWLSLQEKGILAKPDPWYFFYTVHQALIGEGIHYQSNLLLSSALKAKTFDCDNFAVLYLSIAQMAGFPVVAVQTRDHLFLRWPEKMNWEALLGEEKADFYYKMKLAPALVENKIYMIELDSSQLIACQYENIGRFFYEEENFFKSIEYYQKGIELFSVYPGIHNNYGISLTALGYFTEALACYQEAIRLDPLHPYYYNNLGNTYLNLDSLNAARQNYLKAIEMDDSNSDFYNNLTIVQYRRNEYKDALESINRALKLNPRIADYYFNKAMIYYIQGDTKNGSKYYQKGLKVEKKNEN